MKKNQRQFYQKIMQVLLRNGFGKRNSNTNGMNSGKE